jgi:hypothetical protein
MSHSRRKKPIISLWANSDKQAKRLANRALSIAIRRAINHELDLMPELREVSDEWDFPKDGPKRYYNSKESPEIMRK